MSLPTRRARSSAVLGWRRRLVVDASTGAFEALEHGIDRVTVLRKIVEDDPLREAFWCSGPLPDVSDHSRFLPPPLAWAPLAWRVTGSGAKSMIKPW